MFSIEDFVNHRWTDAKEALRQLDADFVGTLENDMTLHRLGLTPPRRKDVIGTPRESLSTDWHRLLEACYEMVRQKDILEVSARYLTDEGCESLPHFDVARKRDYHFRSWVIHADTLCENAEHVIRQSMRVYRPEVQERNPILDTLVKRVECEIRYRFRDIRNDYVHPQRRSWSRATTEDGHWEGCVSLGMTPRNHLDEFYYPMEAENEISGIYAKSLLETESIFGSLGSILSELEGEISGRARNDSS